MFTFLGSGFDFAVEERDVKKTNRVCFCQFRIRFLLWSCLVSENLVFDVVFFGFCAKTYIEGFRLLFQSRIWKLIFGRNSVRVVLLFGGFAFFLVFFCDED